MLQYEPRLAGPVHGLELAPEVQLLTGGVIGTCACGTVVCVPEVAVDHGDLECDGCGEAWYLDVVLKVRRA